MAIKREVPTSLNEDLKILGLKKEEEEIKDEKSLEESQVDENDADVSSETDSESEDGQDEAMKFIKKKIGAAAKKAKKKAKKYYKKNKAKLKKAAKKFRKSAKGKKFAKKMKKFKAMGKKVKKGFRMSYSDLEIPSGTNLESKIEDLNNLADSLFESESVVDRVVGKMSVIIDICEESLLEAYQELEEGLLDEATENALTLIEELKAELEEIKGLSEEDATDRLQETVSSLSEVLSIYSLFASPLEEDEEEDEVEVEVEVDEDEDIDISSILNDLEEDEDGDEELDIEIEEDEKDEELDIEIDEDEEDEEVK